METHQVHSHVKEKHFKHYLFEFFMLFLAVTLGFFVENIREHLVEKRPEGNPRLLTTDRAAINEFSNQIHFIQNANFYFIHNSTLLVNNARKTLAILQNEYNL